MKQRTEKQIKLINLVLFKKIKIDTWLTALITRERRACTYKIRNGKKCQQLDIVEIVEKQKQKNPQYFDDSVYKFV